MSSDQAIAAVSATLRNLLTISLTADPALVDTGVTVQPPDKARGANTANQVNLFLYHANVNAAWRNQDMPPVKPGEAGFPPLPLNLFYLVTVYGRNDDDVFAHRLLGAAMRTLHDHAVLGAEEIKSALPGNDLFAQVERVRLTWQPLSMDDFSKLWTTFQTPYRVSASLEAAVVLLESRRSARAPLPVLMRGPADRGVTAQGDLTPPFPTIETVTPPRSQTGALLGDTVTVTGYHLDGTALFAEFSHPRLAAPIEVGPLPPATPAPPPGSPLFQIGVPLRLDAPTDAARWPAGTYALALRVQKAGEPDRLTNAAPLSLMPRLDSLKPSPATRDAAGDVTLTAQVTPLTRPDQTVSLLLGDRLVPAQPRALETDPLTFLVTAAPAGAFRVRLRVDGVDSPLVQRDVTPPAFDPRPAGDGPVRVKIEKKTDKSGDTRDADRFLPAAMTWLRFLLERQAGLEESDAERREAQIECARDEMAAAECADPPPPVVHLGAALGLSPFERNILLLCCGLEIDTRIAPLCGLAQGDPGRPYPTFALAMALFPDPAWDAVFPTRPLRFWRLIEISQPAGVPLTTGALRADERITGYALGLEGLDDRLGALLERVTSDERATDLAPSQTCLAAAVTRVLERVGPPVVQLLGRDAACKRLVAARACREVGLELYALPADRLPSDGAQAETLARLWGRECRLRPLALILEVEEVAAGAEHLVARLLASVDGVLFVGAREPLAQAGPVVSFDVAKPSSAEQCAAWRSALGKRAGDWPTRLAGQFDLDLAAIHRLAAQSELAAQAEGEEERVWETCRLAVRPRLDGVALRLDARATWEDLVLPPAETDLLRQVADQVGQRSKVYNDWGFGRKMNRGLGVTVLFAGESGTGKTMAAEVLARHLHLDLYRVDLSAVVSKYIGETEKNLRRLFDAAEDGGVILFFDEADALFGKRSEVKDSHDRYANIEVNYLLQRMESYRGLAILATNMKSALDPAFLRRLRFVVSFLFPGPAERRRMWQKAFPSETPTEGLDFDRLARLNLTGGNIHTVALNAAFLAAQGGTCVRMDSVLSAARVEMTKLERPVNEADFFWPAGDRI